MITFVECIPAQFVQECYSIHKRYVDFRAKLNFSFAFSTHDGAYVWLMDAYNTVFDAVFLLLEHFLLLLKNGGDNQ